VAVAEAEAIPELQHQAMAAPVVVLVFLDKVHLAQVVPLEQAEVPLQ
jgi:hypothetical protein